MEILTEVERAGTKCHLIWPISFPVSGPKGRNLQDESCCIQGFQIALRWWLRAFSISRGQLVAL